MNLSGSFVQILQMYSYDVRPLSVFRRRAVVICVNEVCEIGARLIVVVTMVAFDAGVFNRSVHSFYLAPGPAWLLLLTERRRRAQAGTASPPQGGRPLRRSAERITVIESIRITRE